MFHVKPRHRMARSIHSPAMNKYDGVMRGAIDWAGIQFRSLSTSDPPSTS